MIRMLKLIGISVGVVGGVLGGTLGAFWICSSVREGRDEALAEFTSHLDSYTGDFEKSISGAPYIHGQVVIVTVAANDNTGLISDRSGITPYVDQLTLRLPDRLQATDPSQVGTVVPLRWGQKHIGDYSNGVHGYKETCSISIVDWQTQQLIGIKDFEGGDPPRSVSEHTRGAVFGAGVDSDIVAYLESLPQQ